MLTKTKFVLLIPVISILVACQQAESDMTSQLLSNAQTSFVASTQHASESPEIDFDASQSTTKSVLEERSFGPMDFFTIRGTPFDSPFDEACPLLEVIPKPFTEFIDEGEYLEWCFKHGEDYNAWNVDAYADGNIYKFTTLTEDSNLYNYIVNFNLTDDEIISAANKTRIEGYYDGMHGYYEYPITEEQIAALLTRDEDTVISAFISDFSIQRNRHFFTPKWLFYNSIDDYEKVGLKPAEILNVVVNCRENIPTLYLTGIDPLEKKLYNFALAKGTPMTSYEICGYDKDIEMPLPFKFTNKIDEYFFFTSPFHVNSGAFFLNYTSPTAEHEYYESDEMINVRRWKQEMKKSGFSITYTSLHDFPNVYSSMQKFGADYKKLLPEDTPIELINAIGGGDETAVLESVVRDDVLINGTNFYTFGWVYYNKPSTYKSESLNPDELLAMLPKYEELDILTDEAMTALKNKLYDYKENYAQ